VAFELDTQGTEILGMLYDEQFAYA
jgi:hypothetical protein